MPPIVPLVAIVMVFGIPLLAIWASYKLKMKKLDLNGTHREDIEDLKRQIVYLLNDNELLHERLKTVENIVSKFSELSNEDRKKLLIDDELLLKIIAKEKEFDDRK